MNLSDEEIWEIKGLIRFWQSRLEGNDYLIGTTTTILINNTVKWLKYLIKGQR